MTSGGFKGMVQHKNKCLWLFIAGVCVLFLSLPPAFSNQIIINSADQFDFARKFMEKGQYEIAVGEFERFIHFFPDDTQIPTARCLMGICYMKDRRFEAAREIFQEIVRSKPDSKVAWRALLLTGESYYLQGIFEEAEYYLKQVIERCPHLDLKNTALYRLGWARMQAGKWSEASDIFSKVEENSTFFDSSQTLAEQSLKGEELPHKKPAYAGTLAAVVPGLGHAYVSRYRDAAVAFVLNGLFIWATVESFDQDHEVLGGILLALELGWYTGNIYSAVNCAHKYNRKTQDDFRNRLKDQFDLRLFVAGKDSVGLALSFRF
jgi:TolA-binding protein